jgi:uncharacterized RDD family membrane protein YckC
MKQALRTRWNQWVAAVAIAALLQAGRSAHAQDASVASNAPAAAPVAAGDESFTSNASPPARTNAAEIADGQKPKQRNLGDLVVFGRNVEVDANESANDVVVIFGTATIRGTARDTVAIFGNVVNEGGETHDSVAVLGNVRLGTNATVHGDAVAVAGNLDMGPGSSVAGDAVAVGGGLKRADDAQVGGDTVGLEGLGWVGEYVEQCVLKFRPLAPGLPWLWVAVGIVGLLYLLIVLVFPRPVKACATEISSRPATTFLVGLLTKFLLAPVVSLILVMTGIGVVLIPFLSAALLFAGVLGKIGLLQFVGQQLGRQTGLTALERPVLGFLAGWVILTALYFVPVVGFVVMTVTSIWALGAAAMAMFGGSRRELPQPPLAQSAPAPAVASVGPVAAASPFVGTTMAASADSHAPAGEPSSAAPPVMPGPQSAASVEADVLALPRAGFWERMAAGFLDVMLIAIVSALINGGPFGLLVALAYFSAMWTWRGTTIGGIVLNLKVVRYDGQPINFAVALVRSLMAAFSVIVLFLGFLWIAFTQDRQAWHDKIAGTVVVRQPRGMPLLCL